MTIGFLTRLTFGPSQWLAYWRYFSTHPPLRASFRQPRHSNTVAIGSPESLCTLIRRARPRRAVLTTFTFGLAYFEAALLSTLRMHGCEEIVVLVDEREYLHSLAAQFSLGAGKEYRLLAVRAPGGGVFHPKLAYLEGVERDVLVVGSGNLTAAGQGGQLECLDAVSSDTEPQVFLQVSQFFADLRILLGAERGPISEALAETAQRGADVGRTATPNDRAWLVHTLHEPASVQFEALARRCASRFEQVTVLSPFHAPDGEPVLALARSLKVDHVRFAIDPKRQLIALDERRFTLPKNGAFVTPQLPPDFVRVSHAKWWQLDFSGESLVMSGSINATELSFASTKNVEVSLVRYLANRKVLPTWMPAQPSLKYEPLVFPPRPAGSYTVEVELRDDGELAGRVSDSLPVSVLATLTVSTDDSTLTAVEVTLSRDGSFAVRLGPDLPERSVPLQVTLRWQRCLARGWVQNRYQLDLTEAQRNAAGAMRRFQQGNPTEDDEEHVLIEFERLLFADPLEGASESRQSPGARQLLPSPRDVNRGVYTRTPSSRSQRNRAALGRLNRQATDAIYAYLQRRMQRAPHKVSTSPRSPLFPTTDPPPTPPKPRDRRDFAERLAAMVAGLPDVLRRKPDHHNAVELVALSLAENLGHTQQLTAAGATRRCLAWLQTYTEVPYTANTHASLEGLMLVMGCAAIAAAGAESEPAVPMATVAVQAKGLLERFGLPTREVIALQTICDKALALRVFAGLDTDFRTALSQQTDRIAQSQTAFDVLLDLLPSIRQGAPLAPSDLQERLLGSAFFSAVSAHRGTRVKVAEASRPVVSGCPACFHTFGKEQRDALARARVAVCPNDMCRKPVVWLG